MYGLDADLIMLGLVAHAPKFCLLRERQKFQKGRLAPRRGRRNNERGTVPHTPTGIIDTEEVSKAGADDRDFIFLEVELLRTLLGGGLKPLAEGGGGVLYEEERLVDDFVFMCMLVGNDFLPGLPSLDVADGALNLMLRTYTELLPSNGYLTDKAALDMRAFERYIGALARMEPIVFEKKRARAAGRGGRGGRGRGRGGASPAAGVSSGDPLEYKKEYYLTKMGLHPKDRESKRQKVQSYLEGLCWCLAYYHDGCASWDWYYPDFYAPLASDLVGLESYTIELKLGEPFPPLAQLLSVLPPQSSELVPPPYRQLMLSPTSPIFDAYPANFALDLNGKRAEWEAVAMLPFIDEVRLLDAVAAIDDELTDVERARNILGDDLIYSPPVEAL